MAHRSRTDLAFAAAPTGRAYSRTMIREGIIACRVVTLMVVLGAMVADHGLRQQRWFII